MKKVILSDCELELNCFETQHPSRKQSDIRIQNKTSLVVIPPHPLDI